MIRTLTTSSNQKPVTAASVTLVNSCTTVARVCLDSLSRLKATEDIYFGQTLLAGSWINSQRHRGSKLRMCQTPILTRTYPSLVSSAENPTQIQWLRAVDIIIVRHVQSSALPKLQSAWRAAPRRLEYSIAPTK